MPQSIQDELLKKSVRADEAKYLGGALRLWFMGLDNDPLVPIPFALPPYWSFERDRVMRRAVRKEGTWGTAINIASSRLASLGYEVDGDVGLRVRQARKMLGRDWIALMQKTSQDFSSNDNGAFWEIIRAAKGPGAKVLGIARLSPARCIRTGDITTPVVYVDRLGMYHEMKDHQVVTFSDMPNEDYFGVGICATARAYEDLYEHMAVKRFFKEKASGRRTMALDIIKGMAEERIRNAMKDVDDMADQVGYQSYMGTTIIATANNEGQLTHVRVPFVELPSWFKQEEHEATTLVRYSAHLGIDASDLDPRLQNQNLGSGAQAMVLDEKQDAKGQIVLRQQITAAFNDTERWHILPGSVTFAFSENDLRDQKAKADIASTQINNMVAAVGGGIVSVEEARAVLVDGGYLPASFDPRKADEEETLTDEDKANEPLNMDVANGTPEPISGAGVAHQVATTLQPVKLKAGETKLATLTPSDNDRDPKTKAHWRRVTKSFREIGRLWEIAANEFVPQRTGETAMTIKARLTNPDTHLVALRLQVGDKSRPGVAIRSTLYGRKAFSAKRGKRLVFQVGTKTVYAKSVAGVAQNDWFAKSWERITPALKAVEDSFGTVNVLDMIRPDDIAGAHRYYTAQPNPAAKRGGKKRVRK